jgi:DDE domain
MACAASLRGPATNGTSMKCSSTINGRLHFLWRAVDQDGDVLDILVQSRRDKKAAKKFFRKLLKRLVPKGGNDLSPPANFLHVNEFRATDSITIICETSR